MRKFADGPNKRIAQQLAGAEFPDSTVRDDRHSEQYTDDALALKFTEQHGDNLRFTASLGRWSIWNGSVWRRDESLAVFDLARKVCRAASAGCANKRLAAKIASAQTVAAVERLARTDRRHAATIEQWDADPWLLNTPNGVVDLKTGDLRPARREDYMTKSTTVGPGGGCPIWRAFLARITDERLELQNFMQQMCGYALTGVTHERVLFFLYGGCKRQVGIPQHDPWLDGRLCKNGGY